MPTSRISMDELVRIVADENKITRVVAKSVLDTVFTSVKSVVAAGDQVSIAKFGVFSSMRSKAYTARNPQTGEPVKVPAKDRVKFRAYDAFKCQVE